MAELDETRSQRFLTLPCPPKIKEQLERDRKAGDYAGDIPESFTFHRRTVRDSTRIALKQDAFCFGQKDKMNNEALNLQFGAAVLDVTLEVPSGFDFQIIEDDSSIISMFLEYEAWRNGFPSPGQQGVAPPG